MALKNRYYRYVTRVGGEVHKEFIVQAERPDHADRIVKDIVLTEDETVMTSEDITERMREKEGLQEFLDRIHGAERLICTGGKYVSTIESN